MNDLQVFTSEKGETVPEAAVQGKSEYTLLNEEMGMALDMGLITEREHAEILARHKIQLPEVQYFFYQDRWPVRGLFYDNGAWVVAGDLIAPFGLPYHGESTLQPFIPEEHRRYITGTSPHGEETFLCLDEQGIKSLFDMLIHIGFYRRRKWKTR